MSLGVLKDVSVLHIGNTLQLVICKWGVHRTLATSDLAPPVVASGDNLLGKSVFFGETKDTTKRVGGLMQDAGAVLGSQGTCTKRVVCFAVVMPCCVGKLSYRRCCVVRTSHLALAFCFLGIFWVMCVGIRI